MCRIPTQQEGEVRQRRGSIIVTRLEVEAGEVVGEIRWESLACVRNLDSAEISLHNLLITFRPMIKSHCCGRTILRHPFRQVRKFFVRSRVILYHVTAECDGKILIACHSFCTPSKIVQPRQ